MFKILDKLVVIEKRMEHSSGYRDAYDLLVLLHPLLVQTTDSNEDFYFNWGSYFRRRMMCEVGLNLSSEATARQMVEHFGLSKISKEILFSNDSVGLRKALRMAYTHIANYELAAGHPERALEAINHAFEIKSSLGEYEDPFTESYETQARVLREASKKNPDTYQILFLKSLMVLEKKLDDKQIELKDLTLKDDLASAQYQAMKADDPIKKLQRSPTGETWLQSLQRVQEINLLLAMKPEDVADDPEEEPMQVLETVTPETEDTLKALEEKHKVSIPKDLRTCLLTQGAFRVNEFMDWGSFRLYSSQKYDSAYVFAGLVETIDGLWGGRPEFAESFSVDEIKYLNENYFCFGHYKIDDNVYKHLFFDRNGNFDDVYYDQDDWGDAEDLFRSLLTESSAKYTFSAEIASCVDEVIEKLIEEKAERDNEY